MKRTQPQNRNYTPCSVFYKKANGALGFQTESSGFYYDNDSTYTYGHTWVAGFDFYVSNGMEKARKLQAAITA